MVQADKGAGDSGYGDYSIQMSASDQRPVSAAASDPPTDSLPSVDRHPSHQEVEAVRRIRQIGTYIEQLRELERRTLPGSHD